MVEPVEGYPAKLYRCPHCDHGEQFESNMRHHVAEEHDTAYTGAELVPVDWVDDGDTDV